MRRFPPDFMFELTKMEWETLRCNFSTSSQRGGIRYPPFAFTEQGVSMLSAVLNSDKAIDMNLTIMRAFVFIRQYALSHKELTEKLNKLELKYNRKFNDIVAALDFLLKKDKQETEQKQRKRIGFKTDTQD